MRRAAFCGVAISALLLARVSPCFADESSTPAPTSPPPAASANAATGAPTELELTVARERFAEGIKLYSKRKYDQARLAFLQAYVLTKRINVLLNLAQATLRANRPIEALHYFQQASQSRDATAEQKARAESFIDEARSQIGQIKIVAPDGATIELDGQDAGRAPLSAPLDVAPGQHRVRIVSSAEIKNAVVTIAPGSKEEVMLTPKPKQQQDEPRPVPKTETKDEAPGFFSPPSTMAPVYASGAVGLVSLSIAAIFGGLAANDSSSVATATKAITQAGGTLSVCSSLATNPQYTGACQVINDAKASSAPREQLFEVSLGIGIAGTAAALGWYFFAPKDTGEHSTNGSDSRVKLPRVAPFVGDRTAGALLQGSF